MRHPLVILLIVAVALSLALGLCGVVSGNATIDLSLVTAAILTPTLFVLLVSARRVWVKNEQLARRLVTQLLALRRAARVPSSIKDAERDKDEAARKATTLAPQQMSNVQSVKPKRPEEIRGAARKIAVAIKEWSHEQVKTWWMQNPDRKYDAVCDSCNQPIGEGEGYLLARWMRCEDCMNEVLCDIDWRSLLSGANRTEIVGKIRRSIDPLIPDSILISTP